MKHMRATWKKAVLALRPRAVCRRHGFGYIVTWKKWQSVFGCSAQDAWKRACASLIR